MLARSQSSKETTDLTCQGCKQVFAPNQGTIRLTCKPEFHVFCSPLCLVQYCADQEVKGMTSDDVVSCPACSRPIRPDLIAQAQANAKLTPEELQTVDKEMCVECSNWKPVVTYTCGHSLCEDCRTQLEAKVKDESYEYRAGTDPNCMKCRLPESWLAKGFTKAKTFATSDTGMSVLKGVGEQGYKYCCSDCSLS